MSVYGYDPARVEALHLRDHPVCGGVLGERRAGLRVDPVVEHVLELRVLDQPLHEPALGLQILALDVGQCGNGRNAQPHVRVAPAMQMWVSPAR